MGLKVKFREKKTRRADHAMSTCRMSKSPVDGVVDSDLRVHDTENLYISSNAVFPSGSAVNPTLKLAALDFRKSEKIYVRLQLLINCGLGIFSVVIINQTYSIVK